MASKQLPIPAERIEKAILLVRGQKEEKESLGRGKAFMRFLGTNESRYWERDEIRKEP